MSKPKKRLLVCVQGRPAGPTVLVYPEGVMYTGVQATDVPTLIDEHLKNDRPVERLVAHPDIWS
jgi:(2Fe-2S) ferredoxin